MSARMRKKYGQSLRTPDEIEATKTLRKDPRDQDALKTYQKQGMYKGRTSVGGAGAVLLGNLDGWSLSFPTLDSSLCCSQLFHIPLALFILDSSLYCLQLCNILLAHALPTLKYFFCYSHLRYPTLTLSLLPRSALYHLFAIGSRCSG